ncbi:MAG: acetyl-CoA carboxylase, carboxyltransferase subunit beta [Kiritimatiellia bacterium]|nr:acetyl-CoA carboxylase, carboxyltransferase subunit beta [Kiritimatiellia bacterium]
MLFGRRKYTSINVRKKDLPGGLWVKCQNCAEIVYKQEIESRHGVCPDCDYHFPIRWKERLDITVDEGSFTEWDADLVSADPLSFTGQASYLAKLEENRKKTNMKEAIICGQAKINSFDVALGIMDFSFLGGSMGSVVGEKVARLLERGGAGKMPVIIFVATGGARMYEGMFSLMQMAKTSAAVARHTIARLPYIVVLTHPSTAGVMASYGTLGDVIIAEPHALIGFAGPRVIKETTREDVPRGFQRSEFVLHHGLIDMIVHRNDLKRNISLLLEYMQGGTKPVRPPAAPEAQLLRAGKAEGA